MVAKRITKLQSSTISTNERIITKDIAIIRRAAYGSPLEEKLFNTLLLIAKATLKDDPDAEEFGSSFSTIKAFIDLDHNNYWFLRKLLIKIQQNAIEYDILNDEKRKVWGRVPLLGPISFCEDGELKYSFNKPLLEALKHPEAITLINFDIIIKLYKRYSIPLYENFKASLNKGFLELTVRELRIILNMPETQYNKIAEFKRNVINPSVEEINETTDIEVSCNDIKAPGKGGKVIAFKFELAERQNQINIPNTAVLSKIAPIYARLPKTVKDSNAVIGIIANFYISKGEEYVTSNIDYFMNRISDVMIKRMGSVDNMVGLFRTTLEKDYGRDIRLKCKVDELLRIDEEKDRERQEMENLLKPVINSARDSEDANFILELQSYRQYFMTQPDVDKEDIRRAVNELRKNEENFKYNGPLDHAIMNYLKEMKGVYFDVSAVQGNFQF